MWRCSLLMWFSDDTPQEMLQWGDRDQVDIKHPLHVYFSTSDRWCRILSSNCTVAYSTNVWTCDRHTHATALEKHTHEGYAFSSLVWCEQHLLSQEKILVWVSQFFAWSDGMGNARQSIFQPKWVFRSSVCYMVFDERESSRLQTYVKRCIWSITTHNLLAQETTFSRWMSRTCPF